MVAASDAAGQLAFGLSADSGVSYDNTKAMDGTATFSAAGLPAQGVAAKWRMSTARGFVNGATRGFAVKYTIK